MNPSHIRPEIRITLLYSLIGGLWILFSDRLIQVLSSDPVTLTHWQTYKGWAFVGMSALLIYYLLRRDLRLYQSAELELHRTEDKYRSLVEQAPVVIYESEPNGQTVYVSPQIEKFTGFSAGEWQASPDLWLKQLYPPDRQSVIEANARVLPGNGSYAIEYRLSRKDGSLIWIHDEGGVIQTSPAGAPHFRGIWQDITERKQAEEKIQRQLTYLTSLREIDQMIASTFDVHMSLNALLNRVVNLLGWMPPMYAR